MYRVAFAAALLTIVGCDDGGSASEFPAESGAKYEGWAKCNTEPGACPDDWLCRETSQDGMTSYWTCVEPRGLGDECSEWPDNLACDCTAVRRDPANLEYTRYCVTPCDEVQDVEAGLVRLACPDGYTCAEDSAARDGAKCYQSEDVVGFIEPRESRPL